MLTIINISLSAIQHPTSVSYIIKGQHMMEKWKWIFTRTHTFKQSTADCEDEQWRVADRSDWTSAGNEAMTLMMMMKMKRKMKVWMSAGDEDVDHADDDEDEEEDEGLNVSTWWRCWPRWWRAAPRRSRAPGPRWSPARGSPRPSGRRGNPA